MIATLYRVRRAPPLKESALIKVLDHAINRVVTLFGLLALPVTALLFLQWPLRDLVQAGSREANDIGQWVFALYVASSITLASRKNTHLKSDLVARHFAPAFQHRLHRLGVIVSVIPWACFVLWAAWPLVTQSVSHWERFADTGTPGYFIIKGALVIMALLMLVQGLLDLFKTPDTTQGPE